MIKLNKYFNISKFAKMCGVSRQTLIYYDKIKLFCPEIIKSNGYRLYSIEQYQSFLILKTLKEMGTPLNIIKNFFDNRNQDKLLDLLLEEKLKIDNQIEKLNKTKNFINDVIDFTEYGKNINANNDIIVKHCCEEYLILSDEIINENIETEILAKYINYCEKKGYKKYHWGCMVNIKDLINGNNLKYYHYIKYNEFINDEKLHIKKEGLYAYVYHFGSVKKIEESYINLIKFIELNNYEIIGNSYENSILDGLATNNSQEHITEISINIKNKN